jgi:hypothetical protein
MTSPPVVFLGPSLSAAEARGILDVEVLPPVQLGDVWRIVQERPAAIGIIDGYFDRIPAVRHKEILYALSCGIPVYGASSMGALRAAELASFGMIAVGEIAAGYLSGALTCDDEVALMHGPEELGYRGFSEPLVNIRATLAAAHESGVISELTRAAMLETARVLHYPDRTWARILREAPGAAAEPEGLRAWLPGGRIDRKRTDAIAMLERMGADLQRVETAATQSPNGFSPTVIWIETTQQETPIHAILEEFLLANPLAPAVRTAVAEVRRGKPVSWLDVLSPEPDWGTRCRRARLKRQIGSSAPKAAAAAGQAEADELLTWFFGERFNWPDNLDSFLTDRGWTNPATVLAIAAREAAFIAREVVASGS